MWFCKRPAFPILEHFCLQNAARRTPKKKVTADVKTEGEAATTPVKKEGKEAADTPVKKEGEEGDAKEAEVKKEAPKGRPFACVMVARLDPLAPRHSRRVVAARCECSTGRSGGTGYARGPRQR